MSLIHLPSLAPDAGYVVAGSALFDGVSGYLARTPSSAGNRKTWTIEWLGKRWALGINQDILSTSYPVPGNDDSTRFQIGFNAGDQLTVSGQTAVWMQTAQVFRDPSAWLHIVLSCDSTSGALTLAVNGAAVTDFDTYTAPVADHDFAVNGTLTHNVGMFPYPSAEQFLGAYVARFSIVDGQALDATAFGAFTLDGYWRIDDVRSVDFGANGVLLEGGADIAAGTDGSGNGNDYGVSGVVTATNDSPTNDAENGYGNEATWNSIAPNGASAVYANGNRRLYNTSSSATAMPTTLCVPLGMSAYMEFDLNDIGDDTTYVGAAARDWGYWGQADRQLGYYESSVAIRTNVGGWPRVWIAGSYVDPVGTVAVNDQYCVAIDGTTRQVWVGFIVSGTRYWVDGSGAVRTSDEPGSGTNPTYTVPGTTPLYFGTSPRAYGGRYGDVTMRVDADDWVAAAPSGFVALATQNMPAPSLADARTSFKAVAYPGAGGTLSITGLGFQPDLVWIKARGGSGNNNVLYDAVRGAGAGKALSSDTNGAEGAQGDTAALYGYLSSFDVDGFTVAGGASASHWLANESGKDFVAWCFRAGGAGVANADGSVPSTVSVAPHGGLSIVTASLTAGTATVGHGLGRKPRLIVAKRRSSTSAWPVYVADLGAANVLFLNTAGAATSDTSWASTEPTDAVFSTTVGAVEDWVYYCFADVDGFLKVGTYTGNGSTDGPAVDTGFRPAFVMVKRASTAGNDWAVFDGARDPANPGVVGLKPDAADAEYTANDRDFLATGFKLRTSGADVNAASTYVYLAIADGGGAVQGPGGSVVQGRAR